LIAETTTTSTTLPPDTQRPFVGQETRNPGTIYDSVWGPGCATQSVITVVAGDNVGVTRVRGTYGAGLPGSPLSFVRTGGNTWTATFGPFSGLGPNYFQDVVISIVARDAAGNNSAAATVTVNVRGSCP